MKVLKKILLLIIIFHFSGLYSQINKNPKIVLYNVGSYKINENVSSIAYEKIKKNQDKIEFELLFDSISSVYKLVEKMDEKDNMNYRIASVVNGGTKIFYKNVKEKEKFYQAELQGQKFNIQLPYEQYKWDIQNESKVISGFKCYKATTSFKINDKIRGTTKIYNPVVWFTPDIPAPFGPAGLDGLPGLVLEATIDGNKFFYATKIISNENKNVFVERPKNGKKITEKEFQEINANIYSEIQKNKP